jgi:hypothetical protein
MGVRPKSRKYAETTSMTANSVSEMPAFEEKKARSPVGADAGAVAEAVMEADWGVSVKIGFFNRGSSTEVRDIPCRFRGQYYRANERYQGEIRLTDFDC